MTEHITARDFADAQSRLNHNNGTPEDELLVIVAAYDITNSRHLGPGY